MKPVRLKVVPLALTAPLQGRMEEMGYAPQQQWSGMDELAEAAGRLCYKSFDRPNPSTATNEGYLGNILNQQHYSILEHSSFTFYLEGISRSLTHELVRHRHLSPSQVSQRYVDESDADFVIPPVFEEYWNELLTEQGLGEWTVGDEITALMENAVDAYKFLREFLERKGVTKKAARGAARCVLPNMTTTSLVITGNIRAWREVIQKRNSPAADKEIQILANELLKWLKYYAPNSVQDLTVNDTTLERKGGVVD